MDSFAPDVDIIFMGVLVSIFIMDWNEAFFLSSTVTFDKLLSGRSNQ